MRDKAKDGGIARRAIMVAAVISSAVAASAEPVMPNGRATAPLAAPEDEPENAAEVPEPAQTSADSLADAPESGLSDMPPEQPAQAGAKENQAEPASGPVLPPPAAGAPAPDITVTASNLLSIIFDDTGTETATPATAMPYIVGRSCYRWHIAFAPVDGDLHLTEELRLPGPARNWGEEGGATVVNAQRSASITERHFDAATGTATAAWCVAKDDPVGSYRIILRLGEREVARFDFTVGDLL